MAASHAITPLSSLRTKAVPDDAVIHEAGLDLFKQVDSEDSLSESFDSQDIKQHDRKMAKEKKTNALLLQQGN